jgi:RNA polymerase sigma-70 factor (ECF subfamily)
MEESEAIARLKGGDISGLEPLVRAYQVRAVRAAFLICHDRALAEDLVQAAFVRAYERIGQFNAARPFGPWFLQSVVHDAMKAAARQWRTIPLEIDGEEARPCPIPAPIRRNCSKRRRRARPSGRPWPGCRRSSGRRLCCATTWA